MIRKDLEEAFKERIGYRTEQQVETAYVYQEIQDVPEAYREKADRRAKPWGPARPFSAAGMWSMSPSW